MPNVNPLYIYIGAVAIVLATIGGVIYCVATNNKDMISTVVGIGIPIVLTLLGAIGISSHQTNVSNQAKIADAVNADLSPKK